MPTKFPSLESLKRRAVKLAKQSGSTLSLAQEQLAREVRFRDWQGLMRNHPESKERKELEAYARKYLAGSSIDPNVDLIGARLQDQTYGDFLAGKFKEYTFDELRECVWSDEPGALVFSEWNLMQFERRMHNKLLLMRSKLERLKAGRLSCTIYDHANGYSIYGYMLADAHVNEEERSTSFWVSEIEPMQFSVFGHSPSGACEAWLESEEKVHDVRRWINRFLASCRLSRSVSSVTFWPRSRAESWCLPFVFDDGWRFDGERWTFYLDTATLARLSSARQLELSTV